MKKQLLLTFGFYIMTAFAVNAQTITTIAGDGSGTYSGDGGSATNAGIAVKNVAVDTSGNIYIVDEGNSRIRLVNHTTGIISTVVGIGTPGYTGDGGPATAAQLDNPNCIALDKKGNLYIADGPNSVIRKVDATGTISTIAGGGSTWPDGVLAIDAELNDPYGVAVDTLGQVYIAGAYSNLINMVDSNGMIHVIAGTGTTGFLGDGGPATLAELSYPTGVTVDNSGNVYIADNSNNRIRMVSRTGIITTVVGSGAVGTVPGAATGSYSGDGGPATAACINTPYYLTFDKAGNMYIPDWGNSLVRRVDTLGIIETIAGNGTAGFSGDGGPATDAELSGPTGAAIDLAGNLLFTDNNNGRVRKITNPTYSTSIKNVTNETNLVTIYPNPNKGTFIVSVTANTDVVTTIIITNLLGEVVQQLPAIANHPVCINIANNPGLYFVKVAGSQTIKVIVSN